VIKVSEERLQEIKDSIDLQEKIMTKNMLVDEEKELYDEVVRLTNIINELGKWLEEQVSKSDLKGCSFEQTYITGKWNAYKKSLNKLQELKGDSSNE
jgi:hypothetical protein